MPSHPKKAVKAMEHAFRAGHGNIGKEDRHRLAKETGLTPHQISKWASGKRRREWREKNCSRTAGSEKLKRPQKSRNPIFKPTLPEPFRFLTPVDQLIVKQFLHIDGRVFSHVRTALFCTNVMHYDPSGNLIETTCI
uniref:Homeobox domain-containing protein n=1 Tax=Caenorhabditis japonica TaxID=281687 RepID=A0A8R1IK29_CAEJA